MGAGGRGSAALRLRGALAADARPSTLLVWIAHTVRDRDERGGTTVRYDAGPKQGLAVHFYAREELADLTGEAYEVVIAPREDVIMRSPPETGFWAPWEAMWRRR